MAKRNIEERFIAAAPLEQFTALVWYLKRLYSWPVHRVLFRRRLETKSRPKVEAISEATWKRLEILNQYDIELYEWVKAGFTKQIAPLEPDFSRQVQEFEAFNRTYQRIDRHLLAPVRKAIRRIIPSPVLKYFALH
jgi:hypothetical protein